MDMHVADTSIESEQQYIFQKTYLLAYEVNSKMVALCSVVCLSSFFFSIIICFSFVFSFPRLSFVFHYGDTSVCVSLLSHLCFSHCTQTHTHTHTHTHTERESRGISERT